MTKRINEYLTAKATAKAIWARWADERSPETRSSLIEAYEDSSSRATAIGEELLRDILITMGVDESLL